MRKFLKNLLIATLPWSSCLDSLFVVVRVGKTGEFEAFFSPLETLLKDGDEDMRGLVSFGLIEGIQVIASRFVLAGQTIE